jgi:hypothetical protein
LHAKGGNGGGAYGGGGQGTSAHMLIEWGYNT